MVIRISLVILCLTLLGTAPVQGVGPGLAQADETTQASAKTVNFRDPATVPKLRSTTQAQREEAARKAAEYRAEAARADKSGTTAPKTVSPPDEKGAAK